LQPPKSLERTVCPAAAVAAAAFGPMLPQWCRHAEEQVAPPNRCPSAHHPCTFAAAAAAAAGNQSPAQNLARIEGPVALPMLPPALGDRKRLWRKNQGGKGWNGTQEKSHAPPVSRLALQPRSAALARSAAAGC